MKRILYTSCLTFIAVCIVGNVDAQRRRSTKKKVTVVKNQPKPATTLKDTRMDAAALADTSSPRVVTITSAFKPSLKNAAKINFTAASTYVDSSRTPVTYTVPAQNLFFSYQPVPIKPLALPVDTGFHWQNDHFIRAGLGNFNSFLLAGSFSFGDGKKSNTIVNADYLSNKGDLFTQQYAKLGLSVLSVFNTNNNNEWTTKATYKNTTRYFYGFQPSTLSFKKEDLLQRFNEAGIEIGLRNKKANAFNITYAPKLSLKYFQGDLKEYNAILEAPIRKTFAKKFAIDLGILADIANTPGISFNKQNDGNNLFYVSPSVQFQSKFFNLNIGLRPSWDNGKYATLPNLSVEAKIDQTGLIMEAGWKGYFNKNGYRTLTDFNPWIVLFSPSRFFNTKVGEQYAGIKGSAGNHLTYRARLSFMRMNNQPLFPNTPGDGKRFQIFVEPEMDVLQLHGEVGYTLQEKLSLLGGVTYRQFTSLQMADKAWGLLPLEVTGALRWKMFKDLQLKADVFLWDGSQYRDRNQNTTLKLDPAADLNIGAEFSVMPKLNLWIQLNNVLNNRYQRWNQYEVLGLNVLGGVVYSFR